MEICLYQVMQSNIPSISNQSLVFNHETGVRYGSAATGRASPAPSTAIERSIVIESGANILRLVAGLELCSGSGRQLEDHEKSGSPTGGCVKSAIGAPRGRRRSVGVPDGQQSNPGPQDEDGLSL